MKHRLFLFPLLILVCLACLAGCRKEDPSSQVTSQTVAPADFSSTPADLSSAPATDTFSPPESSAAPEPPIPPDYFVQQDDAFSCDAVVIPAAYNAGIAYDIYPYISGRTLFFFLPCTQDLSCVVYEMTDQAGHLLGGRAVDFVSDPDSTTNRLVRMGTTTYTVRALQSDCPTLYLQLDERYGTLADVQNDSNKETRAYGSMLLATRPDIAAAMGWQPFYESSENDDSLPGSMFIKGRGNWTWTTEKKGYNLKLEKKADLLGLGNAKKWALIANVPDFTMLRNPLASYLAKKAGLPYTPCGEQVDLFINGRYYGAFLLSERVEIDSERVDIHELEKDIEALSSDKAYGRQVTERLRSEGLYGLRLKYWSDVPDPEDITGGYLIEMEMAERYDPEPSGFVTARGFYYVIQSPEYVSRAQCLYIASLVQEAENAIYSQDGRNPTTGKYYTEYLDLDSAVKKFLLEELAKNHDAAKTSQFFYKPADSQSQKLFTGPAWDYDIAFGISSETTNPLGWYALNKTYYRALGAHDDFMRRAAELYDECFYGAVNDFVANEMDAWAEKVSASVTMNDLRWKSLEGRSYSFYLDRLKSFLTRRNQWLRQALSPYW